MSAVQGTDIVSPQTLVDPYDYYELLRANPVVESPIGFLVSRYEDVVAVAQDPKVFSSNVRRNNTGTQWGDEPTEAMKEALKEALPERNTLVSSDPPEHSRFKSLAQKGFLPGRVKQVEQSLHEVVDNLIVGFIDRGEVEFVEEFAVPYPLTVIADFLGCDRADVPKLRKWSEDAMRPLSGQLNDDERLACAKGRIESQHYMMDRIRERQQAATDDLLSDLVHAEVDGDRLDELEVLSLALGILVAGNESSRNTLSNAMYLLTQRPELQDHLRSDPSRIPQFVEELLRWEAPVQTLYRIATEDTAIGDTKIPEGSRVAIIWGSANRDPEKFTDPDGVDLHRDRVAANHLAFGYGEHHCIGAALARAELKVGLGTLLRQMDDIRLAPGEGVATSTVSVTMRGFTRLQLQFTKR